MPVFELTNEIIFPPPELAEENGLLAVGGDLSESRVLLAYSMGIFPWYSEEDPLLWWSPDPRLVLFPKELKLSRSLRQIINKETFRVTLDTAFEQIIRTCSEVHNNEDGGTWITEEMIESYTALHRSGYSHSVECWLGDELAGGLYGVSLGSAFFGESMFAKESNASKVAFAALVKQLTKWDFDLIDCQVTTPHLMSLGAHEIPRSEFMELLNKALTKPTTKGKWEL